MKILDLDLDLAFEITRDFGFNHFDHWSNSGDGLFMMYLIQLVFSFLLLSQLPEYGP